jgi:hypothetical protein
MKTMKMKPIEFWAIRRSEHALAFLRGERFDADVFHADRYATREHATKRADDLNALQRTRSGKADALEIVLIRVAEEDYFPVTSPGHHVT